MKPSLQKIQKFFKLEAERGYDNHAVMGGLERMLDLWETEAHNDGLPEDLIQAVVTRLQDYSHLTDKSRAETLQGLLRRIQRTEVDLSDEMTSMGIPSPENREASSMEPDLSSTKLAAGIPIFPLEQTPTALGGTTTTQAPQAKKASLPSIAELSALYAPITVLQGIGPRNAQTLSRLGIFTLRDMLYHFPRRYDDYTRLKSINRLKYGEEVTVIGTVNDISTRQIRGGKQSIVEATITDGSGSLRITWFNQQWIAKRLSNGVQIVLSGKIDQYLGRLVMNSPEWEHVDQQQLSTNRIVPVYPLTAQISQRWLRHQLHQLVTYWAPRLPDPISDELRQSAELVDLSTALMQIHFPDSWEELKSAQDRLAFDEIFLLQLGVLGQKKAWQDRSARLFHVEQEWLERQLARLPFSLTNAQHRTLKDVCHDLETGRPMNRLIQGDVGSGKTVIAALAAEIIAHHGAQVALMTPTSILAEQHHRSMLVMFTSQLNTLPETLHTETDQGMPPLREHEIRLMIGATPESEKQQIREGLASGDIKLVIGTHALIEEPVTFADLQLVIVDEQHRFGVEQRAALRSKGDNPHLMVMTATPIPRSLALTVYGDLDLSIIDEMPPGRIPASTHVLVPRERERAYSLIRSQIQQGHQAFIIYPLVEESDDNIAKAAVEEYTRLKEEVFPEFTIGLLHGRLRPDEKDKAMIDFNLGQYQVLVSTSVVEVGIDIPNATIILIEGANRFGLAQLHQFRGRVGRGAEPAYCLLIPDLPDEIENERLQVMVNTNDGFVLAECDLEQRGPGQFLGTRQSGYAELRLANLTDIHLIEKARRHAQTLFEQDPELIRPEHQLLASALQRAWGNGKADVS